MRVRAEIYGVVLALALGGCASRVVGEAGDGDDGGRGDGGPGGADVLDASPDVRFRDVVVYDVFREDVCGAGQGPGVRMYECDPLGSPTGCADGQACHPSIDYPDGPCGREVYRARCVPSGATPVDGFCMSGEQCASGLSCFATGSGNRCLRLCRNDGTEPSCPRGQVCEPTDLPDFGACD